MAGIIRLRFNILYREVKGFSGLAVDFLRFLCQVPDSASCKHCKCIPKRIYPLLCHRHVLCLNCKKHCHGYYCDECCIHTTPEQLGAVRSCFNDDIKYLPVLCYVCHKGLLLGQLEEHLCEHTNQGRMEASKVQEMTNQHKDVSEKPRRVSNAIWQKCYVCNENVKNSDYAEHLRRHIEQLNNQGDSKVQETANEDTDMKVEETGSDETRPHTDCMEHRVGGEHHGNSGEDPVTCSLCHLLVQRNNLWKHTLLSCTERTIDCGLCHSSFPCSAEETHKYQCPKMARECSDCGVNVLNENVKNHRDTECQKRMVPCGACDSTMCYDERGDHDQECPEKPVVCDECEGEMPRKEKSQHDSECPMRVVHCENCEGYYTYSSEKEHREQCEKKKLACEYCKSDLKGDDEKNAHLQICEEAFIECAFKEFGCNKKAPRREMQEHEKDPHNALLSQVILGLQERIENLEQPLTALVEKLRAEHSEGTSQ